MLIVLLILVLIHELGHFLVAKAFDVKVNEFAIGMGPQILKKRGKETLYSIKLFPIGGSVMMEGEQEASDDDRAYNKKPVWQRFLIVTAGAIMNIVLGFIIMLCLVIFFAPGVGTTKIYSFEPKKLADGTVLESMSDKTGLKVGDKILKVDGKKVDVINDIYYILGMNSKETVEVTVLRDGEKLTIENVKFPQVTSQGMTGMISDLKFVGVKKNFFNIFQEAYYNTIGVVKLVYRTVGGLITGKVPVSAVSGPVGTIEVIGEAADAGIEPLLLLVAMITINLGVFNLLPFPALDGGHVVFLIYEAIRRKPVPEAAFGIINFIGFGLLMLFALLITFKDIFVLLK